MKLLVMIYELELYQAVRTNILVHFYIYFIYYIEKCFRQKLYV